jgi:hypothetical protein
MKNRTSLCEKNIAKIQTKERKITKKRLTKKEYLHHNISYKPLGRV